MDFSQYNNADRVSTEAPDFVGLSAGAAAKLAAKVLQNIGHQIQKIETQTVEIMASYEIWIAQFHCTSRSVLEPSLGTALLHQRRKVKGFAA